MPCDCWTGYSWALCGLGPTPSLYRPTPARTDLYFILKTFFFFLSFLPLVWTNDPNRTHPLPGTRGFPQVRVVGLTSPHAWGHSVVFAPGHRCPVLLPNAHCQPRGLRSLQARGPRGREPRSAGTGGKGVQAQPALAPCSGSAGTPLAWLPEGR